MRKAMPGALVLTSPPLTVETLIADFQADCLWLSLHGIVDRPNEWFGTDVENARESEMVTALNVDYLLSHNVPSVVFADTCFMPNSNMLPALLKAGAKAVVGGSGYNYGGIKDVQGATRLGQWFFRFLGRGLSVGFALLLAKGAMLWDWSLGGRDAREFQVYGLSDWRLRDAKLA